MSQVSHKLPYVFWVQQFNMNSGNVSRSNTKKPEVETSNTYISVCKQDINEIPTAIPLFSGQTNVRRQGAVSIFGLVVAILDSCLPFRRSDSAKLSMSC